MNNISNKALSVITKPTVNLKVGLTKEEKQLINLKKAQDVKRGQPEIINELVYAYIINSYSKTDFFNQTLMPLFEHFIKESESKIKAKVIVSGSTKVSLRRKPDILKIVLEEFGKGRFTTIKSAYETEITIIYDGFKTQVKIDSLLRESISYLQSKKIIKSVDSMNDNKKMCSRLTWIGKSILSGL